MDARMRAYYEQRALEYDDWWLGTGRFAERGRPGWAEEVDGLIGLLGALPSARVLDVACGTGFLTRHLRGEVVGIDQSPTMVRVAAARAPQARIVHAEAVPLPFADQEFDRVVASHFYGHLLAGEREAFLDEARRVARELVIVDSARRPGVQAEDWHERILTDGSRHRVYKRFFTGAQLARELGDGQVRHAGRWFVVVQAGRKHLPP